MLLFSSLDALFFFCHLISPQNVLSLFLTTLCSDTFVAIGGGFFCCCCLKEFFLLCVFVYVCVCMHECECRYLQRPEEEPPYVGAWDLNSGPLQKQ